MKLKLFEFKPRKNVHQTHTEDLVLLGRDGLEELNDKFEKLFRQIKGEGHELNLTQKIDGCLHPDTLVKTTEGDIPFSKLVSDWPVHPYTGYGKDDKTGKVKEVQLSMPRACIGSREWYKIVFEDGSEIIATENHPFMVEGKYVSVDDLKIGDSIEEF